MAMGRPRKYISAADKQRAFRQRTLTPAQQAMVDYLRRQGGRGFVGDARIRDGLIRRGVAEYIREGWHELQLLEAKQRPLESAAGAKLTPAQRRTFDELRARGGKGYVFDTRVRRALVEKGVVAEVQPGGEAVTIIVAGQDR
jgi:hypothetical protein